MSTENHASRKVLLVEDEALVAMVAAETLIELGFDVVEAATARAALDHAGADDADFEFAVIDLGLPDRPGEELIAELNG
jgi:DNA-binding response OmpR family regulator